MRILHLCARYEPARGGAESHLRALATRLAAAGHRPVVATTDAGPVEALWDPSAERLQPAREQREGVQIHRFPLQHPPGYPRLYHAWRRLTWLLDRSRAPGAMTRRLIRYTPRVPAMWRWLNQAPPDFDLVVAFNIAFEQFFAAARHYADRHRLPLVAFPLTHLGAGPAPGADAPGQFFTMRHQRALVLASNAQAFQTPTERQFYLEQGAAPASAHVVGPGVDPEAIAGGQGRRLRARLGLAGPVVVSLGSMSFDKGTGHTITAMARLWQEGLPVPLVLAGSILYPFDRHLADLPAAARRHLHVLGPVDETTRRDLLDAATVIVNPSRVDSFGMVFLEAWCYGRPVIGADAWGQDDVIHHEQDGLLVPFGDSPALAEAIRRLLERPAWAAQLGDQGRQRTLAEHTWDRKAALVAAIYDGLVRAEPAALRPG